MAQSQTAPVEGIATDDLRDALPDNVSIDRNPDDACEGEVYVDSTAAGTLYWIQQAGYYVCQVLDDGMLIIPQEMRP